jgi:hypothetical protein
VPYGEGVRGTPSCSALAADLGEDQAGSAPSAASWLLLEQPGPWGPKAVRQSDLDPQVAAALEAAADAHGVRVGLLRRSARRRPPGPRACFLVSTRPEDPWIERHELADPAEVLELDLAALGAGRATDPAARHAELLLTVCVHGRRDACCARLGRPLFRALAARWPDATWQCSHTGGHRFAPTFLHFPSGWCFGRVPAAQGPAVVEALLAGTLDLELLRGRAGQDPDAQAAEVLARRALDLRGVDDVVPAAHVARRPTGVPRPVSCGDAPKDPGQVDLVAVGP